MSRLFSILILSSSILIADEFMNPNGRPFLLTISSNIIVSEGAGDTFDPNQQMYNLSGARFDITLPISSFITLKTGLYPDSYSRSDKYIVEGEFSDYKLEGYDRMIEIYKTYYGIDLHLPLYKLWEK